MVERRRRRRKQGLSGDIEEVECANTYKKFDYANLRKGLKKVFIMVSLKLRVISRLKVEFVYCKLTP